MKKILAALIAGGVIAPIAQAAPRAESAMECGIAADMAVVAHSLAKETLNKSPRIVSDEKAHQRDRRGE
ncbi:MAG: hypothetical protein EPO20_11710 [Betaproteobacteria bacterium]|nr:MAG: hypothetical protein EPO20_11710 [Betaproteobacteria bacterium]